VMQRPPRHAGSGLLGGTTLWRIGFVSILMVAGAFGTYTWGLRQGLDIETARTMVVNAIVAMEIFYLFSVRYQRGPSITWQGVLGTRAVLTGVTVVVIAQFLFTYWTPFAQIFGARPVPFVEGLFILGVGIALLLAVETEKWTARRFGNGGGPSGLAPPPIRVPAS